MTSQPSSQVPEPVEINTSTSVRGSFSERGDPGRCGRDPAPQDWRAA